MNAQLLIDSIVRQTTVLIAQLATTGGVRAPLAHVANRVFLDLTSELDAQGVPRKVSADMFGMALRAYLRKIQRLRESVTTRGRSLWEAVYDFVRSQEMVRRQDVIDHFHRDDEALVRGVLFDLGESGLVFSTGTGPTAAFRAATEEELGRLRRLGDGRIDELVWAIVFREGPLTGPALAKRLAAGAEELGAALARLEADGRVTVTDGPEGRAWHAPRFAIPLGAREGWEAAVLDHFQAVVKTICCKLRQGALSSAEDRSGGSTYTFEIWPGHPLEDEVLGALARFREQHGRLRERVRAHNAAHPTPAGRKQVVVYGGQCVVEEALEP